MIVPGCDTTRIHLYPYLPEFLTFRGILFDSLLDSLSISHGRSSELKKIHPHRSLGRSGRRHSTAGGRNVSRQYVSHFDRNTDRGHQTSTRRTRGRGGGVQAGRLYRNSVSPYMIEFMTF